MLVVYMGSNLRCHIHTTHMTSRRLQHLIPNFQTWYREQPGFAPGSKRAALGKRSTLLLSTLLEKDLRPLFVTAFPMQLYKMLKLTSTYVSVATINRPVSKLTKLSATSQCKHTLCYASVFTLCTPRGLHFEMPPSSPVANSRIYIRALKSVSHPCVELRKVH